ncbi:hypothetical protein [Hydrogenoanaerobacterium sp.]|uniref:hypothetical protein n=1 Tax=Hydrogenoanaerobacterium sp. TaxID=2953763 RepID=UPI00289CED51|nr:hypothetical protein [Hydrogenoanaerobacterium sp.]
MTFGAPQQNSQSTGTSALSAAVGILLAGAILVTGTSLANALKNKGEELVVKQVFQQEQAQLRGTENKLLRRKTVGLLEQYAFAFADAAINFDTVPKLNSKIFLKLATSMPDDVEPVSVAFDHYDIILTCYSQSEQSPAVFYQRLQEVGLFQSVAQSSVIKQEEGFVFQIICSPHISEGQLTLE